jgi:hypothetical protein
MKMGQAGLPALPSRFSSPWAYCLLVWGVSRLALAAWGALLWGLKIAPLPGAMTFYFMIPPIENGIAAPLLGVWLRWDVIHYLRIVLFGYNTLDLSAFYPVYPLLGGLLSWLFRAGPRYIEITSMTGLMLASSGMLLLAMRLLYQVADADFGRQTAQRAVLLLAVFPAGFFFFAAYPQSTLLFLSVAAYWAVRRERWLLAGIAGLLAGLTHSIAWTLAFMLAGYALAAWLKNGRRLAQAPVLLIPFMPPLGIVLFLAWRISQGFMDFSAMQASIWGKGFLPLWQTIFAVFQPHWFPVRIWANLAVFLLALCLVPLVWKKFNWGMGLYLMITALFLASISNYGDPLPDFMRFISPVFPLYLGLALWLKTKHSGLEIGFAALQLFFSAAFMMWLWIG